jgi:hypothetical protein
MVSRIKELNGLRIVTDRVSHDWSQLYDTAVVCENPAFGGHNL